MNWRMRFSVDAHAIGRHLTGNETYIRNLLKSFAALGDGSEVIAYVSSESARSELPESFSVHTVSANPFIRLGVDLPRCLRRDQPDLLHVQYTAPLFTRVPVVVTVHDISFLTHPWYFTRSRSAQLRSTVRRTVMMAARILTPSEFSKRAIIDAYGLDEERVHVVPNGVSSSFRPVAREVAARRVQARFGINAPFVLTVGDLQPRKNHVGLFRAFEELLREHPSLPHHLVVTGKRTWHGHRVHQAAAASPVAGRIHFTDFVDDTDLVQLYSACDLFVFPSLYEGFGLPILEAMACGRAVACSDTSAMPEVADSAALLFDPSSTSQMTRAMRDILVDPALRLRMERLGGQRAAQFSWQNTATQTLQTYYDVVECERNPAMALRATPVTRP